MKTFWDARYAETDYAYGIAPNAFVKESFEKYTFSGKALFPAEGEGRNAVFAAKNGLEVFAFDMSDSAKQKALALAKQNEVSIFYQVENIESIAFENESFDVLALVFAHFPVAMRQKYHQKLVSFLKPGGYLVLEGFSKDHLKYNTENPAAGGPKDLEMLFSEEELKADFNNLEIVQIESLEIDLNEGKYHVGKSAVIRLVAKKK